MLKVININNIDNITCDTTQVTADNTLITADSSAFSSIYELRLPYRFFTENVILHMFNEYSEEKYDIAITATENDGYMVLQFNFDFKNGQEFEAKILDTNGELICMFSILSTTQTNLQDFSLTRKDNNITYV